MEPAKPGQDTYVTPKVELYDSGCTRHLSPTRVDFENYIEIASLSSTYPMVLTPRSCALRRFFTLQSLTFSDGKCVIIGPNGERAGEVPKNWKLKGVYKVEHEAEEANRAEETLTLDQLHCQMGHISPSIAQKHVKKGFVTGMQLESTPSGVPVFCESCVYAKTMRKSAPKQREGERASEFGGEVHSDVWGPAPVESRGGKRYHITFTDDKTWLTNLYLLAKKSDAFEAYKDYEEWVSMQLGARASCRNQTCMTFLSISASVNGVIGRSRVKEGRWVEVDERSKAVRVYWPDSKTVSVERKVYYDNTCSSASRLEGEEDIVVETKADSPVIPSSLAVPPSQSISSSSFVQQLAPSIFQGPSEPIQTTNHLTSPELVLGAHVNQPKRFKV
ncbi:hypothetical protein CVT26_004623 [Gymnopilus dilepis]|uniref:GAG-pre-integrase domain-containing protein n=1 Tax=Gymnopilus dilepis TaxID=231916 RepID=A0A409YTQ6_9AGAR|nr:hypothetical protein CVT26_004623 [Gymnopilus dilepis]